MIAKTPGIMKHLRPQEYFVTFCLPSSLSIVGYVSVFGRRGLAGAQPSFIVRRIPYVPVNDLLE
jgi:hypothetical protein